MSWFEGFKPQSHVGEPYAMGRLLLLPVPDYKAA